MITQFYDLQISIYYFANHTGITIANYADVIQTQPMFEERLQMIKIKGLHQQIMSLLTFQVLELEVLKFNIVG